MNANVAEISTTNSFAEALCSAWGILLIVRLGPFFSGQNWLRYVAEQLSLGLTSINWAYPSFSSNGRTCVRAGFGSFLFSARIVSVAFICRPLSINGQRAACVTRATAGRAPRNRLHCVGPCGGSLEKPTCVGKKKRNKTRWRPIAALVFSIVAVAASATSPSGAGSTDEKSVGGRMAAPKLLSLPLADWLHYHILYDSILFCCGGTVSRDPVRAAALRTRGTRCRICIAFSVRDL